MKPEVMWSSRVVVASQSSVEADRTPSVPFVMSKDGESFERVLLAEILRSRSASSFSEDDQNPRETLCGYNSMNMKRSLTLGICGKY